MGASAREEMQRQVTQGPREGRRRLKLRPPAKNCLWLLEPARGKRGFLLPGFGESMAQLTARERASVFRTVQHILMVYQVSCACYRRARQAAGPSQRGPRECKGLKRPFHRSALDACSVHVHSVNHHPRVFLHFSWQVCATRRTFGCFWYFHLPSLWEFQLLFFCFPDAASESLVLPLLGFLHHVGRLVCNTVNSRVLGTVLAGPSSSSSSAPVELDGTLLLRYVTSGDQIPCGVTSSACSNRLLELSSIPCLK